MKNLCAFLLLSSLVIPVISYAEMCANEAPFVRSDGVKGYYWCNINRSTKNIQRGGFVATTAFVEDGVTIGLEAQVLEGAQISGDVKIIGRAIVSGDANVRESATISGTAQVYGRAEVFGSAQISGNARVFDDAKISGNAKIRGESRISGTTEIKSGVRDDKISQAELDSIANEKAERERIAAEEANAAKINAWKNASSRLNFREEFSYSGFYSMSVVSSISTRGSNWELFTAEKVQSADKGGVVRMTAPFDDLKSILISYSSDSDTYQLTFEFKHRYSLYQSYEKTVEQARMFSLRLSSLNKVSDLIRAFQNIGGTVERENEN